MMMPWLSLPTAGNGPTTFLAVLLLFATCGAPPSTPPDDIRDGLVYSLTATFHAAPDQIHLMRWEPVEWPDACLGIAMRPPCPSEKVAGHRLLVDIQGKTYEYRSAASDPLALSLAAAPEAMPPSPALAWERQEERCLSLRLYDDGQGAFGYCDAPHAIVPLRGTRPDEWNTLRARFAPFTYKQAREMLVFDGQGSEDAPEVWRRAISTWAGMVHPELTSGRTAATWGTAFVWQRPVAAHPERCDYLTVMAYGRAFASRARCEGGDAVNLGDGWIQTDAWELFDRWYYRYGLVESAQMQATLHFYGQGTEAMPDRDGALLTSWAETLFARLSRQP